MAKSRNNLLGVGGQRKKPSRTDLPGTGTGRDADRKAAEDSKQELLRRMRERTGAEPVRSDDASSDDANATAGDH
ncbi:DUF6243 family protein [uncultured Streptomyces sp.]|uniref:DUF6243 family protein n=1 Tax=uncultured Streptomyces sp. TaxID=174707 RepID=UPI0026129F7E|nr:DUF6243 family protein [uncultured Streptomyces sp.]